MTDRGDSLSTPERRLQHVQLLCDGVPLVNRLLGLRIRAPTLENWHATVMANPEQAEGNHAYAQLLGAVYDTPVGDLSTWWPLVTRNRAMLEDTSSQDPLPATHDYVLQAAGYSQEQLVDLIKQEYSVRRLDFPSLFERPGFVYVKVNHYHWEYISHIAMEAHLRTVFRRLKAQDLSEWQACGVDELVIQALRVQQRALQEQGHDSGVYDTDGFSFGIGFNNGDGYMTEDLVTPVPDTYWPLYRGAMTGSFAFFKGLLPADHYTFSDGAHPKMMVWEGRIPAFFKSMTNTVDAIVFIVPDPLRGIFVRHWQGASHVIVVPDYRVHELWPAVMPVVAAQLAEVFRNHHKVCVLVQAALMSVPLGILVDRMRPQFPSTDVFFFDMGQALDIALYPDHPSGLWLRHPEIREVLSNAGELPLGVHTTMASSAGQPPPDHA